MDIQQVRKANLIKLIGDVSERGAAANFAKKYNLSPDQVRHMLTGFRPFSEKIARKFEIAVGIEAGSLDQPLSNKIAETAAKYAAQRMGEDAINLLEAFEKLPKEKQQLALRLIQTLDD
jgi:hypothetical protein